MKPERLAEIALLLQEWRVRQLHTERYMGELKAAAEDLGIDDLEMLLFCTTIFTRMLNRKQNSSS